MAILVADVVSSKLGVNIRDFVISTGGCYTLSKNQTGDYFVQFRMFYYINEESYRAKGTPIQEDYSCLENIDPTVNIWSLIFADISSKFEMCTALDP